MNTQLALHGDDELRDAGEDLGASMLEEVEAALDGEEPVRLLLLAETVEEDGEVVVVVELLNLDLPGDLVAGAAVLDGNGEVSAVVEAAELRGGDRAAVLGASAGGRGSVGLLSDEEGGGGSSDAGVLVGDGNFGGWMRGDVEGREGEGVGAKRFAGKKEKLVMRRCA